MAYDITDAGSGNEYLLVNGEQEVLARADTDIFTDPSATSSVADPAIGWTVEGTRVSEA